MASFFFENVKSKSTELTIRPQRCPFTYITIQVSLHGRRRYDVTIFGKMDQNQV